jgi:probable rRNA maturation factor
MDDDSTPLSIDLVDRQHRLSPHAASWLPAAIARALAPLALQGEIRIAVVNDDEMARTHEEFCDIPGTTDVLTFDCSEPTDGPVLSLDTDIVVCIDEAERQAQSRGHPPEREFLLYVVHGVLHCLGYDDHEEDAAAAMHRREDELLEQAGIGATFAREGGDP